MRSLLCLVFLVAACEATPENVLTAAPAIEVVAPAGVTPTGVAAAQGVPASFVAPHQGTVSRVGDNLVEVVMMPKGEVRTYTYELSGTPIPAAEVELSTIEVKHNNKPYKAKMKPSSDGAYLTGYVDAKVTIPASAQVVFACPEPVKIRGVVYHSDVVVFTPYVVAAPIVIVPTAVVAPGIIVVPPSVHIGVGVSVGHSHKKYNNGKHKGHYKH